MAETLTIRTSSSTEVVKIAVPGPQGATGQGVPVGGSTGQVLRKASGTDYDTEWAAAGSGSGSVTSVALASSDLTITGSPITSSGTITANIAANAVTLEKLQTISSEHLLGRHGNGNGGVQQIGLGTGLAMSGSNIQCTVTAPTASSATPSALGTAAAGSATDYARADHVHSAEVSDSAFRVLGSTDATKKVAFEVDTNVPTGQTVTLTAPNASGTIALTSDIPAAFDPASPGTIGGTTPAAATFTNLTANTRVNLPNTNGTTAGDIYRNADTLRYRDSTNTERTLLSGAGNLANLSDTATARTNLGLGSAATRAIDNISDSDFRVSDNGDSTKKVALECSGISASTTRTLTIANRNGTNVVSDTSAGTGSSVVNNIVAITQANYDAISSPDAATLYLITDP